MRAGRRLLAHSRGALARPRRQADHRRGRRGRRRGGRDRMASLKDADLALKLGAREGQERVLEAQRRLLALRVQLGGLLEGPELGPALWVLVEGWGNLTRRADYEQAIEEMLAETDHAPAPWQVSAAESKPFARATVLETVISRIEAALRALSHRGRAARARTQARAGRGLAVRRGI